MTYTSKIITSAYRESNLIAKGASPDSDQVAEALERLQVLFAGVLGYEVGRNFVDWPIGQEGVTTLDQWATWTAYQWAYPPINMRLIAASTTAQTVYLHPQPSDGARMSIIDPAGRLLAAPITIDANGRGIEDALTYVANADNLSRDWMYRADLGKWTLVSALTGVDPEEWPFPLAFDDFFVTRLAMRLNPRYGRSLGEASVVEMSQVQSRLRARYEQKMETWPEPGSVALTRGYGSQWRSYSAGDVGTLRNRRLVRPPHYEG